MAKGPRSLGIDYRSATLTHYGGAYLMHRFLTRLGVKAAFAHDIRVVQRNHRYSVGEMLLALLYPMVLGLERIETTQLLRQNGVFQFLTGLRSYPDPSTMRRFLLRVAPVALLQLRKLHDRFLSLMLARPRPPVRLLFDLDSTVLVLYGRQEGARVGYNPLQRVVVPITRCCASKGRPATSGMANCAPAMWARRAARWSVSKPASPKPRATCGA
jgi:Transposase DDE domain group 1